MGIRLDRRCKCCLCGERVASRTQYIEIELHPEWNDEEQLYGAHRACLSAVLAPGFDIQVTDPLRPV